MGKSLNKVELIGHLGADVEMRYTPNGAAVANVNIATARSYKATGSEEWTEETEWTPLVLWSANAENINKYAHKGSRVYVEGRLATRSWDDKDTGAKRYKTEVVVDNFILLDAKPATDGADTQPRTQPTTARPQPTQTRQPARNVPQAVGDEALPF